MSQLAANLRAAGLMLAAMALYGVSDAMIKHVSAGLPIGEIMGLRGIVMCLLLYAMLRHQGHPTQWRVWLHPWNIGRGTAEIACAGLYFAGISRLPLGDASALFFVAPIILTALAALILKEHVGPRRWTAVAVGFFGVMVVAGPPQGWTLLILLPLTSAFFSALRDIVQRRIPAEVPAGAISLVTAAAVMIGGFATLPFGWVVPTPGQAGILLLSAAIVGGGYQCYVLAIRAGDISFVSPFRYVAIPLAMLLGFIGWGDVPTPMKLLGACIIVGSGLFIFYRERQLALRAQAR
jgi:drug/metabolite transporter (DMT)-like permease